MPWKVRDVSSLREEFVRMMSVEGSNVAELCRRYGVARKTAYKWLKRYEQAGREGLGDRSRRPLSSPRRTAAAMEERILEIRDTHPAWGARKLRESLRRKGVLEGPSISTITEILRRHGRLDAKESDKHRAFVRFEHPQPNDLWQMDFKGHFALSGGGRCHPLTILDDHSRFALELAACGNERSETVQTQLQAVFRRYGLPQRMLMDNGSPWGGDRESPHTALTVWLMRLGIHVTHGRPYHPQTQGKDERFHRTLNVELLSRHAFIDLQDCQTSFDPWRYEYNFDRPHEALQMASPASRYQPSTRAYPQTLPPIEYSPGDEVRRVHDGGWISFRGQHFRLSKAFYRQSIGLRPTLQDGVWVVLFGQQALGAIDLRDSSDSGRVRRVQPQD